jgi:transposase-like protein
MNSIRKRHSPEFKAKVALEAIKERRTVNEIAGEMAIHPVQVSQWKKIATDSLSAAFGKQSKPDQNEALISRLYQEIGQLKVELDWLKKKSAKIN